MATLERAIEIAVEAHKGQKDKAGMPYILHTLRLMFQMKTDNEKKAKSNPLTNYCLEGV
jgi:GTP diphosphokinase / guanosine-3',5'-bis(diphosphate) 3'-diphosphatase